MFLKIIGFFSLLLLSIHVCYAGYFSHFVEPSPVNHTDEELSTMDYYKRTPVRACKKMETYCGSCSQLITCLESEYGYVKLQLQCSLGETCLRNKCVFESNPFCDGTVDMEFKCVLPGMFPDPIDCQAYHFCVPTGKRHANDTLELIHYKSTCPDDEFGNKYRFDSYSLSCKFKMEDNECDYPVPLCTEEGHYYPVSNNRNLFYVCSRVNDKLYPRLFNCPRGSQFDSSTFTCSQLYDVIL